MSHNKGKSMKHEHSKSQQVKTRQRLWQPFIVASQATKTRHPGKTALHEPTPRQQHETALGMWQLDDLQLHTLLFGLLSRHFARVSLIDKGQFHRVPGDVLHGLSQFAYLGTVLFIGGRDMQRQQMAQRINCQMHLAPFTSFRSIVACSMSTFWARLQRPAIEDCCRWLFLSSFG